MCQRELANAMYLGVVTVEVRRTKQFRQLWNQLSIVTPRPEIIMDRGFVR